MVGLEENSSFLLGGNQQTPSKTEIKEREKKRGKISRLFRNTEKNKRFKSGCLW